MNVGVFRGERSVGVPLQRLFRYEWMDVMTECVAASSNRCADFAQYPTVVLSAFDFSIYNLDIPATLLPHMPHEQPSGNPTDYALHEENQRYAFVSARAKPVQQSPTMHRKIRVGMSTLA
jgi:hypothetical protein